MKKTSLEDYGISVPAGAPEEYCLPCPECSPGRKKKKARCLSVNTSKQVWVCHHCGWRGGVQTGIESAPKVHKKLKPWTPPNPSIVPLTTEQVDWFAERGISRSTLDKFGVFGGTTYFPEAEDEAEAIRFPYYDGRTLYSVKSRTSNKMFTRTPGARKIFYGMNFVPTGAKTLIIVEGEVDLLALHEIGMCNCVSVPDGAPPEGAKEIRLEYLEECQEFLDKFTNFIIATDGDGPGRRLEGELSRRLGVDICKRVVWPDGCKDANDVLVNLGENELRECIVGAVEYPVAGVYSVKDISEDMYKDFKEGEEPGLDVGFDNMHSMFSMRPGEFTVIAGIPHSGKSAFVTQLAVNMAHRHEWPVAIFPAENLPLHRYANSIIELYSGKTMRLGARNRITEREYIQSMGFVHNYFRFILPSDDEFTVGGILEKSRAAVRRYGCRAIILDPFTEISDANAGPGVNSSDHIGRQLTKMRTFARNNGVHLILVAHPRMQLEDPKTGVIRRPNAYSIAGSANFYNKADNILIIHRWDKSKNTVEVYSEKVRFRIVGRAGLSAYFEYNRLNGRFSPAKEVFGGAPVQVQEPRDE